MQIEVLKSKLHCVKVTEANLNYMGSITIDEDLMDAVGIIAGERVYIVNNNNGERFDTYVIRGERGSGCICLNGAAARKVQVGDVIKVPGDKVSAAVENLWKQGMFEDVQVRVSRIQGNIIFLKIFIDQRACSFTLNLNADNIARRNLR